MLLMLHMRSSPTVACKSALLLLVLPLLFKALSCDCWQAHLRDNEDIAPSEGCIVNSLGLRTASRHAAPCEEMPASLYSYSVQAAAAADSLQSSEFSDRGGGLTGSFELEYSLTPADILLIVLGEAMDSFGASKHGCHRLAVCNQSADGLRQRLRLSVSLRPSMSYTMKIFKLANGSSLCEPPRVRFFITRSSAAERPLLQLAVRRCGGCESRGADFRCRMDAYLLADWPERVRLSLTGVLGERSDKILFGNQSLQVGAAQTGWTKANLSMQIKSKQLTLHFFNKMLKGEYLKARRNIYAIAGSDASLQRPLLCQSDEPLAVCPTPPPPTVAKFQAPSQSRVKHLRQTSAVLLPTLPLALVLVLCLALYRVLIARQRWRESSNQRRLVLLVLPDDSRRCEPVQCFRRFLAAAPGVEVRKVVGLRHLSRSLACSARLIVFISWDASFSSFRDLPNEAASRRLRTLLLAEKHRARGFYIDSEPALADQVWAGLEAKRLGDDEAAALDLARSLLDLLRDDYESSGPVGA